VDERPSPPDRNAISLSNSRVVRNEE
jgi:hypothetical protein